MSEKRINLRVTEEEYASAERVAEEVNSQIEDKVTVTGLAKIALKQFLQRMTGQKYKRSIFVEIPRADLDDEALQILMEAFDKVQDGNVSATMAMCDIRRELQGRADGTLRQTPKYEAWEEL